MKKNSLFWGLAFLITTLVLYRFTPLKESLLKDFSSVASQSGQLLNQAMQGSFTPENYNWKLKAMDGTIMDVSGLKGKVLLVSFWKFPCKGCTDRFKLLQNLYDTYKNRVTFLMIFEPGREQEIFNFMQNNGYTLPVYTILSADDKGFPIENTERVPFVIIDQKGQWIPHNWDGKTSEEKHKEIAQRFDELIGS